MVKKEGECFCEQEREGEGEHTCGIDCSSWVDCCSWLDDDVGYSEGDWDRLGRFNSTLKSTYVPKVGFARSSFQPRRHHLLTPSSPRSHSYFQIVAFLKSFALDLVLSPSLSRSWDSHLGGHVLNLVVGTPIIPSLPAEAEASAANTTSLSLIENSVSFPAPWTDWSNRNLDLRSLELRVEERNRFRRLARALRLEKDQDDGVKEDIASDCARKNVELGMDVERRGEKRKISPEGLLGRTSLRPSLMLVHRSWGHFS